jgi:hypothetical protein
MEKEEIIIYGRYQQKSIVFSFFEKTCVLYGFSKQ